MQAINELTNQGYTLSVDHDEIVIKYIGAGHPDPATVKPLLAELKAHKAEAINYLQQCYAGHPSSPAAPLQEHTPEKPRSFIPGGLLPDGMEGSGGEDRTAGASVADNSEAQRHLKMARGDQALTTGTPDECNALGAACRETIGRQGYCLAKSAALGDTVAIVEADTRRNLAPEGYAAYTLRELELLAEGYQAGHIVTIGDLRMMHEAKKKLGGRIIQ